MNTNMPINGLVKCTQCKHHEQNYTKWRDKWTSVYCNEHEHTEKLYVAQNCPDYKDINAPEKVEEPIVEINTEEESAVNVVSHPHGDSMISHPVGDGSGDMGEVTTNSTPDEWVEETNSDK